MTDNTFRKITFLFCLFVSLCSSAQISQAEYFWDTDPGQGNGISINAADGALDEMSEALIASSIAVPSTPGLHKLGLRVKEANNNWSDVFYALVSVANTPVAVSTTRQLTQAEYFWDTDPGQGNGISINAADGNLDAVSEALIASGIAVPSTPGLHKLGLRVKEANNNWSDVFYALVSVANAPVAVGTTRQLTQAEFFWDTDPGTGNGQTVFAADGSFNQISEALNRVASTSSLSLGKHVLYARVKDVSGNWSEKFGSVVIIDTSLVPVVNSMNGNLSLCSNALPDTLSYSAVVSGASSYTWTINGGSILSGQGTAVVSVIWNATGPWSLLVQGCNVNGCGNADSLVPVVNVVPNVSFTGLNTAYCNYDAVSTLVPNLGGGVFSGTGISGNLFNPALVNGTTVVSYTYNSGSCPVTVYDTSFVTVVNGLSFSGLNSVYCSTDAPAVLSPNIAGGTFSGAGVSGNTFSPSMASDTSVVIYTYVLNGCTYTSSGTAYIGMPFTVAFSGLDSSYCSSDAGDALISSVSGGIFSGNGISGASFSPAALSGNQVIYYSVTQTGCTASTSDTTVVFAAPPVPTISNSGDTLSATGSGTFQWINCTNGNQPISGATGPAYVAPGSGSYAVIVSNGTCSSTSACFNHVGMASSFNQLQNSSEVTVYPNPGNGTFFVSAPSGALCKLYDYSGRLVMTFSMVQTDPYKISGLSEGVYFMETLTGQRKLVNRVVVLEK